MPAQADLSIGLALALLCPEGLRPIQRAGRRRCQPDSARRAVGFFLEHFEVYRDHHRAGHPVSAGTRSQPGPSHRRTALPAGGSAIRGARTMAAATADSGDALEWAFGALGLQDRAKHIATLYLNDLADVIRDAIDPRFEFVRYAESLAASQPTLRSAARRAACAAQPGRCLAARPDACRRWRSMSRRWC